MIERITRPTHEKLRVDITVDDPKAYTKTRGRDSESLEFELRLVHITEMICEDNVTFNNLKNQVG